MLNPLEVAASSVGVDGSFSGQSELPTQWWKEIGRGYQKYLGVLKDLGVSSMLPTRRPRPQQQPLDPRLIQQMMNTPNVMQYGGRR